MLASGPNAEVQKLVKRLDLERRIEEHDYTVKLVFVTNAPLDSAGANYVLTATEGGTPLEVFDGPELGASGLADADSCCA